MMKLREEYEQLSRDYQEACRVKHEQDELLTQTQCNLDESKLQVGVLEEKLEEQRVLIEELEKRREAAKKEIKQLYVKLNKKEAFKPDKPEEDIKIDVNSSTKVKTETAEDLSH